MIDQIRTSMKERINIVYLAYLNGHIPEDEFYAKKEKYNKEFERYAKESKSVWVI